MSEEFKDGNRSVTPQAGPDVVFLIKKIQEQLVFLEKKIDLLIKQSQGAPPREKFFPKPYRSFDRPHRQDKGEFGHKKKSYDNSRGAEHHGFVQKKKPFYYGRKDHRG